MDSSFYISTICSAVYGSTAVFIAVRARQLANIILVFCCIITSIWAALSTTSTAATMVGPVGIADVGRLLLWYCYLIYLYKHTGIAPARQLYAFTAIAIGVGITSLTAAIDPAGHQTIALFSAPILARLLLSVSELLLIENMYLNLPEHDRWHVVIPCVLLGGIACFDILVAADTALIHSSSSIFLTARTILLTVTAPLLVLAAFRGQRWIEPVRLSQTAVFHSATLVLSGSVLVVLAGAGEIFRRVDDEIGWVIELSLISSGILGLCLLLSSRSARSAIQRVLVNHFYADRYDYRVQWLRCISTLSGTGSIERTTLATRAIRAIADVVDSPSGALFVVDGPSGAMNWTGSWNMPSSTALPNGHPWVERAVATKAVVELSGLGESGDTDSDQFRSAWLAVPLLHNAGVIGLVITGHPRVSSRLEQEVADLLAIVGREVGTYIAEQQATEAIHQTQQLRDYSKRFAFVAHDIKNVASQLALLVNNAEHHLSNPEFQVDMVKTVQASVEKIDHLLKRLDQAPVERSTLTFDPVARLQALTANYARTRGVDIALEADDREAQIAANLEIFDTIVIHLLNNAVESGPDARVTVRIQRHSENVIVDITDTGTGMSADFIRDELFVPFKTSKVGGSGIGAFQARELLRENGGELQVSSEVGVGTRVRVILPSSDRPGPATSIKGGHLALSEIGGPIV